MFSWNYYVRIPVNRASRVKLPMAIVAMQNTLGIQVALPIVTSSPLTVVFIVAFQSSP